MNARDEAKDLQVDWALREQLGAEQPPDLTEAVLARLDQDAGDPMVLQVAQPRNRRWLAAALVLLGIGAVLGAALWPRSEKGGGAVPAQTPQDRALDLHVFFPEAGGLRAGDPVLVQGKRTGQVAAVAYRAARQRLRIEVVLRMDAAMPLATGYQIEIRNSSVLGGRHVEIAPGSGEALREGSELVGSAADNATERTAQPLVGEGLVGEERPTEVANLTDVAVLPTDTRAIEAHAIGDEVLAALAALAGKGQLPKLESLTVVNPAHQTYGLGLKMTLPPGEQCITAASMKHIAALSKLRRLVLSGTFALRKGLGDGASLLEDLVRLPLLTELTIRCVDTSNGDLSVLPRLPTLQKLDLSFNHGFAGPAIESILRCQRLSSLSLRGCQQLQPPMLARLGGLPRLERLDLGLIDGMNWRNVPDELRFFDEVELGVIRRAVGRGGAGVTDDALVGIASAKSLRWLDITGGNARDRGYAALGELPGLEVLNMSGVQARGDFVADLPKGLRELHVCGDYDDAFCTSVREHLRQLRHLDVAACYKITDAGVAGLIALPDLRILELRQCRGLTPGCIDTLVQADQIEELDLRHVDWVVPEHIKKLREGMASLRMLHTHFGSVSDPATREIIKRLEETKLEHSFASATIKDWATYYGNVAGVTFIVTPEVRDLDAASTTLTDFKLPRMSVAQALKVIQAQTGVAWTVKDGMVLLVARSAK